MADLSSIHPPITDDALAEMWTSTFARFIIGRPSEERASLMDRWATAVGNHEFPDDPCLSKSFQILALKGVTEQLCRFVENPSMIDNDDQPLHHDDGTEPF